MKYEITKGSEKDFEGAPEWCLQVIKSIGGTRQGFVHEFDYMCKYQGKEFGDDGRVSNPSLWEIIAERRPTIEPVWDGEGLPPVGYVCEVMVSRTSAYIPWRTIHIEGGCIWGWRGGVPVGIDIEKTPCEFRNVRSPKDVARDEAIAAMRDIGYTLPAAIRFSKEEMSALYDALSGGKIPGIPFSK